jgi:hypothetical protein
MPDFYATILSITAMKVKSSMTSFSLEIVVILEQFVMVLMTVVLNGQLTLVQPKTPTEITKKDEFE